MAEVKTPPRELGQYVCFGPEHTWADIVRWIKSHNKSDVEEVIMLLKE